MPISARHIGRDERGETSLSPRWVVGRLASSVNHKFARNQGSGRLGPIGFEHQATTPALPLRYAAGTAADAGTGDVATTRPPDVET